MHRATNYLLQLNGGAAATKEMLKAFRLDAARASILRTALRQDARDYYYSSCLTFAGAVQSFSRASFTWSTVQLYYAVFYALRSFLAAQDLCIFYVQGAAFSIRAVASAQGANLRESSTHKCVFKEFRRLFPSHILLSQEIGALEPLEWLTLRRETANYRQARFAEPTVPPHMLSMESVGVRQALNRYVQDTSDVYTFDEDHAIAAFPLKVLRETKTVLAGAGSVAMDNDDIQLLRARLRDNTGPLIQVSAALT